MGSFVRGGINGMGYFVRDDKNCMGCFVRDGKSMRDVLSEVSKNGMGCFVPGCFVLHSLRLTKKVGWFVQGVFTRNYPRKWDVCPGWQKWLGMFCPGRQNGMGCYVRGDRNSIGCFVRGGKSLWDVLSGVAKMAWDVLSLDVLSGSRKKYPTGPLQFLRNKPHFEFISSLNMQMRVIP